MSDDSKKLDDAFDAAPDADDAFEAAPLAAEPAPDVLKRDVVEGARTARRGLGAPLAEEEAPDLMPWVSQQAAGLVSGLAEGATFGFADELYGAGAGVLTDKSYEEARDEARQLLGKAREEAPVAGMLGDVGGAAGTGVGAAGLLGKGAGAAARMGLGAVEGALHGAGRSEAESGAEMAKDVAVGGALGGAFAGAAEAAKAGGRALRGAAAKRLVSAKDAAEKQAAQELSKLGYAAGARKNLAKKVAQGVDADAAELGWIRKNLGDGTTRDMLQKAQKIKQGAGKRIGALIQEAEDVAGGPVIDSAFYKNVLQKMDSTVKGSAVGRRSILPASRIIRNEMKRLDALSAGGELAGDTAETLLEVRSALSGKMSDAFKQDKTALGRAFGTAIDAIDDQLESTLGKVRPDLIGDIAEARGTYAAASRAKQALTGAAAAAKMPGAAKFGQPALTALQVVKDAILAAPNTPQGKVVTGLARVVDRMAKNKKLVKQFGPALESAAKRGPTALAARWFVLRKQHPELAALEREAAMEE